ncbi:hypothetical protein MKZ38_010047 [Zalerion maritima]|uniref:K Homology domain-containing protein n=1 Tax=Zalerion maritima TaxID=339359 RepID=A0AAD5RG71_9PEZI|nr:hypothetical protein MKZ38_010047 [Zalerion maritima]
MSAQDLESDAMRLQNAHAATVEEVPDEDDLPVATTSKKPAIDTKSTEMFPELGMSSSKPVQAPSGPWGKGGGQVKSNGNGNETQTSAPPNDGYSPGSRTPSPAQGTGLKIPGAVNLPGRNADTVILGPNQMLDRKQMKRPLADLIRDANKRGRVRITHTPSGLNHKFEATGPPGMTKTALYNFLDNVSPKITHNVPIPSSTRALLIGRGGQTIKAIQERTGARITIPKDAGQSDEGTVEVAINGNTASVAAAVKEVNDKVGQQGAEFKSPVKGIPAEFYHFIAGPNNETIRHLQEVHNVTVQVPEFRHVFPDHSIPREGPDDRPSFFAPHDGSEISISGNRTGVQFAKEAIEHRTGNLYKQLRLREDAAFERGQLQFIIDDQLPMSAFFSETGCVLVMPEDEGDEIIRIIGPDDEAIEKALEKCNSRVANIPHSDVSLKMFGGSQTHCWNLARYLRDIGLISKLESEHSVRITTPMMAEGSKWGIYTPEFKNISPARNHIFETIQAFPQTRMRSLPVDEFYYAHLKQQMKSELLEKHNVRTVVPQPKEKGSPVLLVFEGPSAPDAPFQTPRTKPTAAQVSEFQQGLDQAVREIETFIKANADIDEVAIEVSPKYHLKLRKFVSDEKKSLPANIPAIRVSQIGTTVKFRGLKKYVDELVAKVKDFVKQEEEYDKERGFTLSFEFPQKFANHLIGKGGQNIQNLRDKFDVEIQVKDGMVDLKGPKVKAEAARSHILALGKQLADEATHALKVDPKYHSSIIGSQGSKINKLEDRYKVRITFPHSKPEAAGSDRDSDAGASKPRREQNMDEVVVRGPRKGADEARDEILSLVNYLRDHGHEATIVVKQKHLPSLIGSGGRVMDEIRTSSNARIDVQNNSKDKGSENSEVEIHIQGTDEAVKDARKQIMAKVAVLDDMIVETIQVDRQYHRALIGTGGNTLREIILKAGGPDDRREHARIVRFPQQDSEGNTIKVEGRKKVVEGIISAIQSIVSERESQVSVSVDVPTEKHRSLIGRGGEKKRELESQFSVSIDIPRQGDGRTDVKITGQPDDTAQAKAHIESMIKEQQGETMQVPRKLHHAISNNGRFFKDARNTHKVTIDHAGQKIPARPTATESQSSAPLITEDGDGDSEAYRWAITKTSDEDGDIPWNLKGTPENIAVVKELLLKEIEKAKTIDTRGFLELNDTSTYRYVIGQQGRTINRIRKETGCDIQVPRNDSSSGIVVIGSAAGAEKARDLILNAIREGKAARRD